jgi:hypothetical protein
MLPDSFTNAVRRAFLFSIDVWVLYFVISRYCSKAGTIVEVQAAYCVASVVTASVAFFESQRNWLLYADIAKRWSNDPSFGFYLSRGGTLRAEATAGHALSLGFLLAVAFGFWLYCQHRIESRRSRNIVTLVLWLGLLAAYSRGPWMGALVIYVAFVALGPRAGSRIFKAAAVVAIIGGVIALSPLGERVISVLPFMGGTVDSGSLPYRQRLTQRSFELILASPFFGDHFPWAKMEDLRQGEGIIDLVNTYATVALLYGIVGLSLFVGFIFLGLSKAYLSARTIMLSNPDLASLGISITACILGALVMISSNSFGFGIEKMFYVLGGLAAAYSHLRIFRDNR